MAPQLLLDPEAREGVSSCLAEERLTSLDFEESYVVNQQFERDLEAHVLFGGPSWWFGDAWAEMRGTFWWGRGAKIVREQVAHGEADSGENRLDITPRKTMEKHPIACGGDRQRGAGVVVEGTADLPALARLSSAPAALGDGFGALRGRPGKYP
jgi:hypothetical protein